MIKDAEGVEKLGDTLEVLLQDEEKADGLRKNIAALAVHDSDVKIPR